MMSIVIPVYMGRKSLPELYGQLVDTFENEMAINFEILFVNDCCPQNSWQLITEIAERDKRVKGINLSRNFGQHQAIIAGLELAKGDWVVVMDCDFQDNPIYIPLLYNEAQKGFDLVFAKRMHRNDSISKKIFNAIFYSLFSYLTDSRFDASIGNFGIYGRKPVNAVLAMKEPFKVFSLMMRWVGYKTSSIPVEHGIRRIGRSSYTFSKLMNLALTIIFAYSQKPLLLTIKTGILISTISIMYAIYNVLAWCLGYITVSGFASIIASIWLLGGMIIFTLGILGLYLGRTFEGVKNRPVYLIDGTINL